MNRSAKPASRPHVRLLLPTHTGVGRRLLRGVAEYARRADWSVEYEITYPPSAQAVESLGRYDGLIVTTGHEPTQRVLRRGRCPAVLVSCLPVGSLPLYIGDNRAVGRLGAEHLLAQGYDTLGFYASEPEWFSRGRAAGFAARAAEQGRAVSECWNAEALGDWLVGLTPPAGVMAANDLMAMEVIRVAREAGLAVPEDLAVLGADDDELFCELVDPPLSSIDTGPQRIGYQAARHLDALMRGRKPKGGTHMVAAARLVHRRSTVAVAVAHPEVRRALHFIQAHATERIGVQDVAEQTPISRRRLEQLFRQHLNRSIHQELLRVRIDVAKHLLATTDLPITRVALRCGFGTPSSFADAFGRTVGQTPRDFRQRGRQTY